VLRTSTQISCAQRSGNVSGSSACRYLIGVRFVRHLFGGAPVCRLSGADLYESRFAAQNSFVKLVEAD
jgi:hypothetical protein